MFLIRGGRRGRILFNSNRIIVDKYAWGLIYGKL